MPLTIVAYDTLQGAVGQDDRLHGHRSISSVAEK